MLDLGLGCAPPYCARGASGRLDPRLAGDSLGPHKEPRGAGQNDRSDATASRARLDRGQCISAVMHGRGCRVPRRGVPHIRREYSADYSTESGFFIKPGDFVEIAGVGRVVFARVRGWSPSVPVPAEWCRFLQGGGTPLPDSGGQQSVSWGLRPLGGRRGRTVTRRPCWRSRCGRTARASRAFASVRRSSDWAARCLPSPGPAPFPPAASVR